MCRELAEVIGSLVTFGSYTTVRHGIHDLAFVHRPIRAPARVPYLIYGHTRVDRGTAPEVRFEG